MKALKFLLSPVVFRLQVDYKACLVASLNEFCTFLALFVEKRKKKKKRLRRKIRTAFAYKLKPTALSMR